MTDPLDRPARQEGWGSYPQNVQKVEIRPHAATSAADTTAPLQRGRPFPPGKSGNPDGRPKGSKNRLTDTFLSVIEGDFGEHGPSVLARLRDNDPGAYLRIVASLIPRDLILNRERERDFSDFSIPELMMLIEATSRNAQIERQIARAKHDV